jgi:hypothetical protein
MPEQPERYLAAILGFGFVATWSAAGLGAALAALTASAVAYAAVAFTQGRSILQPANWRAAKRPRAAAPRRPARRHARPSERPPARPEPRHAPSTSARPVFDVDLADVPDDLSIPAVGRYGW